MSHVFLSFSFSFFSSYIYICRCRYVYIYIYICGSIAWSNKYNLDSDPRLLALINFLFGNPRFGNQNPGAPNRQIVLCVKSILRETQIGTPHVFAGWLASGIPPLASRGGTGGSNLQTKLRKLILCRTGVSTTNVPQSSRVKTSAFEGRGILLIVDVFA